ncbi:GNAT family protein [Exiguobacterium sp. SL14]|nr:GNAT family protein [Exiguobacterium sp. SL14]MCY1690865.1 GNAT family protein [Exiguobacterium sp. SL14]
MSISFTGFVLKSCLANIGSIRVLEKVGFRQEGVAKQNLFINEAWEDFILFALLKEDWKESRHANL